MTLGGDGLATARVGQSLRNHHETNTALLTNPSISSTFATDGRS